MSIRNLNSLFQPRSVAVIGASIRPGRVGSVVMKNLLSGGFEGPVMPVNPKYESVAGVWAYASVEELPVAPDLAVICTPTRIVPEIVRQLGNRGTKSAIVLTAGLSQPGEQSGRSVRDEMLEAARPHGLRILGPNCLGLLSPGVRLNASFAHLPALPGSIAFASQSGALCTAVLDWAHSKGIGFSHFISLGDLADIDFGDVLDYLSGDPDTRSILLYIESITSARKFMSAARAASRNKTVLAIKAGRVAEGAQAAASHTGAMAGSDDVYDAALRRAGMLRVFTIDELFGAVETLARPQRSRGEKLVILTNGGGPGVLATDALVEGGGALAELSEETLARLDEVLPPTWSRRNPIDIIGDAGPERYAAALRVLTADRSISSVLVLYVPTAISSSTGAARAVIEVAKGARCDVLTSWLGRGAVDEARRLFARADLPTYETPEDAVRGFLQVIHYRHNQEMLMEVPASVPEEFRPSTEAARFVVEKALAERRDLLTEPEAKVVLSSYGIPVVETHIASTPEDAATIARKMGSAVALKILSPDLTHKSDVGGVVLDLETPERVREAAVAMLERVKKIEPGPRVDGFTVQKMARRPGAHELIVGITTDPTFGPVMAFGEGGTAVEVVADRALALPPLNMHLAKDLVAGTRVFRRLQGYRSRPAADLEAICLTLVQISQLLVDMGEVLELDINPLLADENGVLALDARLVVRPTELSGAERLSIRPYPKELEEWVTLSSGQRILFRPIRPEDEPAHYKLFSRFSNEDMRFRFFGLVRSLPHSEMARYTQIDYDREMAFIATAPGEEGEDETLGVVRIAAAPDKASAEFAIIVRSDVKGRGLGRALLEKMIGYCRDQGIRELRGQVLHDNTAMLGLARRLGFRQGATSDGVTDVVLETSTSRST